MKKAPVRVVVPFLMYVVAMVATSSAAVGAEDNPPPADTQPQTSSTAPATTHAEATAAADPHGIALELSTGALLGDHDAALGLGWGAGRFAVGVGFAFQYSSLTRSGADEPELTESALALGPWLRWDMARGFDDRVGVVAALDVQYCRQSNTLDATANGVSVRVGPGIRFWATPWFAVGYTTQLAVTSLWGPRLAFVQVTTPGASNDDYEQRKVALVGRLSALAVF